MAAAEACDVSLARAGEPARLTEASSGGDLGARGLLPNHGQARATALKERFVGGSSRAFGLAGTPPVVATSVKHTGKRAAFRRLLDVNFYKNHVIREKNVRLSVRSGRHGITLSSQLILVR